MGMREEIDAEMLFPDQISGPPVGWRSARSKVAMFRAIIDLHTGVRFLSVWKQVAWASVGIWRMPYVPRRVP